MASATPQRSSGPLALLMEKIWWSADEEYEEEYDGDDGDDDDGDGDDDDDDRIAG